MPAVDPSADHEPPAPAADPGCDPSAAVRPDGRTARALRTRTTIVDALLGLLDEGDLQPTASQIAARAGISLRLIYHHFGDLESLFRAVAERQAERVMEQWRPIDPRLPLGERIDALIDQRLAILDLLTPVRRAGLRHEASSTAIGEARRLALAAGRAEIELTFAPELQDRPVAEREALTDGLHGLLGWGCWNELRSAGLSADRARAALRAVLAGLFGPGAS
jgi:TetR/AcrR family transcriptional regulator, regulator of autoinduction and epiphytic fitness